MEETERRRWNGARAYAQRQRCDAAVCCDYADWIVSGVRAGSIQRGAPHSVLFEHWMRAPKAR